MSFSPDSPSASLSATLADARTLDDGDLCLALVDVERSMRQLAAANAALTAELFSRVEAMGYPLNGASEELATLLAISPRSADARMSDAIGLCEREVVWTALSEGRVDHTKAKIILNLLADIPDPRREELELIALGYAEHHTGHELRRKVLAMTCDDPEESLRKDAIDRRGVWISPAGYGMADIHAHLSAEQAEAFYRAVENLPGHDPYQEGEDRTAAQLRADALVGFLNDHVTVTVNVDIVIPADALIGDNAWTPESKRLGPIGSQLARDLCLSPDARWRRLLTDPVTGELVAMGTTRYEIPKALREAIRARDLTCRFPGCTARAEHLDTDHTIPYPRGTTTPDNLAGLCRRHHRTKTFSAWKARRVDEDLVWTSPLKIEYNTGPHRYRADE